MQELRLVVATQIGGVAQTQKGIIISYTIKCIMKENRWRYRSYVIYPEILEIVND